MRAGAFQRLQRGLGTYHLTLLTKASADLEKNRPDLQKNRKRPSATMNFFRQEAARNCNSCLMSFLAIGANALGYENLGTHEYERGNC